jgi:molybdenum cofactor cytidylyltransferase
MADGVVGILLAAGRGLRFGSDKSLHPLPDGTPMALASARALMPACGRCVVVLRPQQRVLAQLLRAEGMRVVFDARVAQGMGASLAAAVRASASADGWVVALADMPFLEPATSGAVVEALESGASLAAPFVAGRRGHPVGFARAWFGELVQLQGDQGARALLQRHRARIVAIPSADRGALRDVDTPAALFA